MTITKTSECVTKEFDCCAPDAENVCLAGSFNDWSIDATPMQKDKNGHWQVAIELPPGRHEFKFVVDGKWHCESNCVPNDYGTMNQIIDVE